MLAESEVITVYTLFDITHTGVLKMYDSRVTEFVDQAGQLVRDRTEWCRSRNQQRNWEILVQLISLRTQPTILANPELLINADLSSLGLGAGSATPQTVWRASFSTEHAQVYSTSDDYLGQLRAECRLVPMITGLNETAQMSNSYIETQGEFINTSFVVSQPITAQPATPRRQ